MALLRATDGTSIHYSIEPGPDPVLLIHGFASNAELNWVSSGWVRFLAEVGRGSILVDLRGHGESGKPHDPAAYSPATMVADLIAVLDAAGAGRADVVGYSMGAQLARMLEHDHPERVRRLVLAGLGGKEQFSRWGANALKAALLGDASVGDPVADGLVQALKSAPGVDLEAVSALVAGMAGHRASGKPVAPTLVIAGTADNVASDAESFAASIAASYWPIPKRTHLNAITSRRFKIAVQEFLS